jgi:hypothetical protein
MLWNIEIPLDPPLQKGEDFMLSFTELGSQIHTFEEGSPVPPFRKGG